MEKYQVNSDVTIYLKEVENDILDNLQQFIKAWGIRTAASFSDALDERGTL